MIKFGFYVDSISSALKSMEVTDAENNLVDHENSLLEWCRLTQEVKRSGSTIYIVGNGASAMMASHMAADVSKNGEVKCLAFNDPALMTAVSNDIA
jgi:D-sedoheptulose 7-phosphate isomerase